MFSKKRTTTLTKEELEEWYKNLPVQSANTSNSNSFNTIQLPTVKRVMANTIGDGGWVKSKKQQLKEDRINKLRKLKGNKPNVKLEKDEYVEGLVSVQPLSAPIVQIFYADLKYETAEEKRKERKDKLEYIDKILNNNDKKI
jgi:hypothetical protein